MLWDPSRSFLECILLFVGNFALTLTSHSSGLSVCHTEDVISLDSPINSTVTWDWVSKLISTCLLNGRIVVEGGLSILE